MSALGKMFGAGSVDTFLGWPKAQVSQIDQAVVAVLGVPTATPYASVGAYCASGPAAIREGAAPYAANAAHHNFDLGRATLPKGLSAADCGDLDVGLKGGAEARIAITGAIRSIRAQGAVPILMGGDDSVPIPFLEAFADRSVAIVQVDAHIDWREDVDGERFGLSSTMRRASEMDHVGRIVQIGQRGLGSARVSDVEDALDYGVEFIPAKTLHRHGVDAYRDALPEEDIVLVFDVDAFDPAVMPAAIGRTAGGLSFDQALQLVEDIASRARIVGMTLAEFMPERDHDGQGALLVAQFLTACVGIIAGQALE